MKQISIDYSILSFEELPEQDQVLVKAAQSSLEKAHAPYSKFYVGSAVRDINGKVTTGNNQENAAYPSGLCAERVALFAAKSLEKTPLSTIVVLAANEGTETSDAFPCGNCRQVMMEYASLQDEAIRILMQRKDESYILIEDVKQLLPFHFDSKQLK